MAKVEVNIIRVGIVRAIKERTVSVGPARAIEEKIVTTGPFVCAALKKMRNVSSWRLCLSTKKQSAQKR